MKMNEVDWELAIKLTERLCKLAPEQVAVLQLQETVLLACAIQTLSSHTSLTQSMTSATCNKLLQHKVCRLTQPAQSCSGLWQPA